MSLRERVGVYLDSQKCILWSESFDIASEEGRQRAEDWLVAVIKEVQHGKGQERADCGDGPGLPGVHGRLHAPVPEQVVDSMPSVRELEDEQEPALPVLPDSEGRALEDAEDSGEPGPEGLEQLPGEPSPLSSLTTEELMRRLEADGVYLDVGFCQGCSKVRPDTDNERGLCSSCMRYYGYLPHDS